MYSTWARTHREQASSAQRRKHVFITLTRFFHRGFWESLGFAYSKVGKARGVMNVLCGKLVFGKKIAYSHVPSFMWSGAVESEFCLNFSRQPMGSNLLFAPSLWYLLLVLSVCSTWSWDSWGRWALFKDGRERVSVYYLPLLPVCVHLWLCIA